MVSGSDVMAAESGDIVRIWGDLSSTYRERESGDSDATLRNLRNTGTINASSYIWRPWFALINGSLSLSLDETDTSGQETVKDEYSTGDVQFDLFPTSRFPFRAYLIESRNEIDNRSFDQIVKSTEYGFSQQYRNEDGTGNYLADYENNEQDRGGQEKFQSESLLLSASNRFALHDLDTDIKLDTVDNTITSEEASAYLLTLDHSYGQATNFTVDNLLSTSRIETDLFESGSEVDVKQLSSLLSWHLLENKDLRLTGSLRVAETETFDVRKIVQADQEFETVDSNAINLSQGLIYEYTDNLRLSQSINLNEIETNNRTTSNTGLSLGLSYASDNVVTGLGDYAWSFSSTYSRLSGDVESQEALGNQFGHSLSNNYSTDGGYQLRTELTQSLNYDYKDEDPDNKRIDHSYSATWSSSAINNQNLIRLFISDSRELNRDNDYFQLVNLQYSGSNRLSRYSQLSGNTSLQYTNQRFERKRSEQTTSNGQINYRRNRLFQVLGLSFESELQLSERQTKAERLARDPDEDTQASWENSLLYRIGRLETRIDIDVIKVGNEYDRLFKIMLKRSFGDL
jgi:hypothetical protein